MLGGGCSGLSYQFKFDPKPRATDNVFTFEDVQVYVDPKSMVFLDGMTLDWKDSLHSVRLCVRESAREEELWLRDVVHGMSAVTTLEQDYFASSAFRRSSR